MPSPGALRHGFLPNRRAAPAPWHEEGEWLLFPPRQVQSLCQDGKNVPIEIHERFPDLDLLLNYGIKRGKRLSGWGLNGIELLPFLGMEMTKYLFRQDETGRSPNLSQFEGRHPALHTMAIYYNGKNGIVPRGVV